MRGGDCPYAKRRSTVTVPHTETDVEQWGEGGPGILGEGERTQHSEYLMVYIAQCRVADQIVKECDGVLWREKQDRGPCESIISICVYVHMYMHT